MNEGLEILNRLNRPASLELKLAKRVVELAEVAYVLEFRRVNDAELSQLGQEPDTVKRAKVRGILDDDSLQREMIAEGMEILLEIAPGDDPLQVLDTAEGWTDQ